MFILLIIFLLITLCIILVNVIPVCGGSKEIGEIAITNFQKQLFIQKLKDYTLVAAIVEPREKNLVPIIRHYLQKLPDYTHFQIYHGQQNVALLKREFVYEIDVGKISLWDMGVRNLTIQAYNYILTSPIFWKTMQSNNVLIFQTDTVMCPSGTDISQFFKYDYIGAPMNLYNIFVNCLSRFYAKGHFIAHTQFFNGGLSLRKRDTMIKLLKEHPWDGLTPEDVWFCAFLPNISGIVPDKETARAFSYEDERLQGVPWGVHKPNQKSYRLLEEICPDYKIALN